MEVTWSASSQRKTFWRFRPDYSRNTSSLRLKSQLPSAIPCSLDFSRLKSFVIRNGCPSVKSSLRRSQTRDRQTEGRAAHVVEPDLVTKGNRGWLAAVLAADADLE